MRRVYRIESRRTPWRKTSQLLLGMAAFMALTALYTHIEANRTEQAFPPIGEFARVEGLRLHYKMDGSGPAVVLIHGASTSLRDFDASIFEPLTKTHRVIAVDRPGHGYSERPNGDWPSPARQARVIQALLEQLGVERPLLVGHSWSGSVVLAYLLNYPDDAAGGVLLAGGSHPWKGGVAWYHDLAGLPIIGDVFARTLAYPLGTLVLDSAVAAVFNPDPVPEHYRQQTGIRLSLRPEAFLANAQDVRLLSRFLEHQSPRYDNLRSPLLLVTGGRDRIVPSWNHADRLTKQAADVDVIRLETSGHAMHHVRPEKVVDLIEAFSARLRAAADPDHPRSQPLSALSRAGGS